MSDSNSSSSEISKLGLPKFGTGNGSGNGARENSSTPTPSILDMARSAAVIAASAPASLESKPEAVQAAPSVVRTDTAGRIIEMYAQHGDAIKFKDIATILRVSAGYVTQVITDNLEQIVELRAKLLAEKRSPAGERADQLDRMEKSLLNRMETEILPFLSAKQVIPVLREISRLPRYHQGPGLGQAPARSDSDIVEISLPHVAITQYNLSVDSNNRVVSVNGATLMAASADQVKAMLPEFVENEAQSIADRQRTGAQAAAERLSKVRIGRQPSDSDPDTLIFD